MRIDAHQHFWKYSPASYGWISDKMQGLKRDFLPMDLKPLLTADGFSGSIAVQARQDLDETRWLLELADNNEFIKGVVGWVDLCSRELPAQLEEFTANPKFVGVRHILQDEPDDEFMLRSRVSDWHSAAGRTRADIRPAPPSATPACRGETGPGIPEAAIRIGSYCQA